jgi:hypothetical protein
MRVLFPSIFLTLVLATSLCFALPRPLGKPDVAIEIKNINDPQSIKKSRPLDIEDKFYFSLSYSAGNYANPDEYTKFTFFQMRYIPYSDDSWGWDYQLGISNLNWLSLSMGKHWYCCPEDSFKPYARLSGSIYTQATEELGGLIEFKRWRANLGIGVGSIFTTEFGFGWSLNGRDLYLQCGFSF